MSHVSSEEGSMSKMQRKMNKIAAKRQRELLEAREQIASFLKANDFPKGGVLRCDTNGTKGIFFVTFPLHEAVKQNNPYMTANLLLFGAIPAMKDTWGRTAFDYAKGKKSDTNGKKGIFFVTFPLHEAVKQNNPYMTANLLLFGAIPAMKDTWGRTAFDYAKGKKTHQQILKASRHSPSAPSRQLHLSQLQRHPPPRGFEEFFAKLAEDPLVQAW
eukprot:Skav220990  [mRNA]  locus=scaffold1541:225248:231045:+ [translate_table: standard]